MTENNLNEHEQAEKDFHSRPENQSKSYSQKDAEEMGAFEDKAAEGTADNE